VKVINDLKKTNPLALMLVGSAVECKDIDEIGDLNDIDIFVIYEKNQNFQREIKTVENIEFDINYFDLDSLELLIEREIPFILKAMHKNKLIFSSEKVEKLIDYGCTKYVNGPNKIEENEIKYLRFDYSSRLQDINKVKGNRVQFNFLADELLHKAITDYYRLNRLWVPKNKKKLIKLKDINEKMYELCIAYLQLDEAIMKYEYLAKIIENILNNYGGLKNNWEKGDFPII